LQGYCRVAIGCHLYLEILYCLIMHFVQVCNLVCQRLRLILPTKLVTECPENCRGKVPLTWQDLRSRKTRRSIILEILCFDFAGWVRGRNQEIRASLLSSEETWATKTIVRVTQALKILQASESNEVHKHPSTGLSVQQPKGQLAFEGIMIMRSWCHDSSASVESIHWINSQPKPGKKKTKQAAHLNKLHNLLLFCKKKKCK
jgi:hypothetical protein